MRAQNDRPLRWGLDRVLSRRPSFLCVAELRMLEPQPCSPARPSSSRLQRGHEFAELMTMLPSLDLERFRYVSAHARSRFDELTESWVAGMFALCHERSFPGASGIRVGGVEDENAA
jgi:hypothetical protein